MRKTLDIDDDLLAAAREIARREHQSLGAVISRLARETLTQGRRATEGPAPRSTGGFRPFPSRGTPVTNEAIDQLRDEAGT